MDLRSLPIAGDRHHPVILCQAGAHLPHRRRILGILRPAQQRQFVYIGREHICLCCQAAHRITPCFIKPIVQAAVVCHDRVHHQERIRRAVDSQKVRNAVPLDRIAEKAGDDAVRLYLLPVRSKLGHKAGQILHRVTVIAGLAGKHRRRNRVHPHAHDSQHRNGRHQRAIAVAGKVVKDHAVFQVLAPLLFCYI